MLKAAGTSRSAVHITNVVNKRPANNKFSNFTAEEITQGLDALEETIRRIKPNVIVALGATPLRYLTGEDAITKYRGSVIPCTLVPGFKVLATFHPAWLLRGQDMMVPVVIADLAKAVREDAYPEIRRTERRVRVMDTVSEIEATLHDLETCAVDIETSRIREHGETARLRCIGFAPTPTQAYVVPYELCHNPRVLRAIARYLANPHKKIFHNAIFDTTFLMYFYRIYTPPHVIEDIMLMHHDCYPQLPKSLAFCASLYTNEPYWKDTGKDEQGWRQSGQDLYLYNGMDCCLTRELWDILNRELDELEVREAYEFDRRLLAPALYMTLRGLRVDFDKKKELQERQHREEEVLRTIINKLFPGLNPNSPKQLKELLYDQLGFPVQKNKGKVTTDARALRRLGTYPFKHRPILDLFLKWGEVSQLRQFVDVNVDPDGRVRYYMRVGGTISGRLSSSKFITLSGFNFQNQPKSVRSMYVPDEGMIFVQFDLSQAEARLTAALCGDERWLRSFDDHDVHTEVACELFGLRPEQVERKTHRQTAKRVSHGANYMMGWRTLADILLCPPREAKAHLEAYYAMRPKLREWQESVKRELMEKGEIRTIYGRRLPALYNPLRGIPSTLHRQAVSFRAQSMCPDYLNRGLVRIYEEMPHVEVLLQVHDSGLTQMPADKELVWNTMQQIKAIVEQPIKLNGLTFIIPLDFEIGMNWGEMYSVTNDKHVLVRDKFEEAWDKCMSSSQRASS